jgi:hypothetical protein
MFTLARFHTTKTQTGSGVCIASAEDDCLISHSITSSAVASSVGGTVRPSILAASAYRMASIKQDDATILTQCTNHALDEIFGRDKCAAQRNIELMLRSLRSLGKSASIHLSKTGAFKVIGRCRRARNEGTCSLRQSLEAGIDQSRSIRRHRDRFWD